jgi:type II secretory pathway pseudopilin PulG
MALKSDRLRNTLQVVMAIVIVVLAYFLYYSITEPYEAIEREERLTEQVRNRMVDIRTALNNYERDSTAYPDSLDQLMAHIQRDSALLANRDSVFMTSFELDSMFYSPRNGEPFTYTLSDTGQVPTYLLEAPAPDTTETIGTLSGDPTRTNVASWE